MHSKYLKSLKKSESVWAQRFVPIFSPLPCQDITVQDNTSALKVLSASITTGLLNKSIALSLYSPQHHTTTTATTTPNTNTSVRLAHPTHVHLKDGLTLRETDLISEGIDFHCDGEIVRAVRDRYRTCCHPIAFLNNKCVLSSTFDFLIRRLIY